jgi:hypothetical protein
MSTKAHLTRLIPRPREALITMTEHDLDHLLPDGSRPPGPEEHRVSTCDDAAVLLAWITLSRVADGHVTTQDGHYLDGDIPLPPYLAASVPTLFTEGSLTLADLDSAGWQQLTLTDAGQIRYEELRRRAARGVDQ